MRTFWDEIAIIALSTVFIAIPSGEAFAIVGFLGAIILASSCHLLKAGQRMVAILLFCIAAMIVPSFAPFLPVVSYEAMEERLWSIRLIWIVPLGLLTALHAMEPQALGAIAILSLIAAALAIRDIRDRSDWEGLRFAYDNLKEQNIQLGAELQRTQEGTTADARAANFEAEAFADLTQRELAVVRLVAEGMDNREIASKLFLSEGTVRNHISAILAKKQLSNRTQIAVTYYRGD